MKIQLNKFFGKNMITRNSVKYFFKKHIENSEDGKIILDFNNIKFITRACAAEYIKLREKSPKEVSEINMSDDVKNMFRVIVNQLKNSDFKFSKASIIVS